MIKSPCIPGSSSSIADSSITASLTNTDATEPLSAMRSSSHTEG